QFDDSIKSIDDLIEGAVLNGIVTNVTNFGAFVDIGIKQNGLVHISEISNTFIQNPADVVKLHQAVKVRVLSVDKERERIQLSMRNCE
ncbi:MAG: S1 RNA-binding domain-containing protein, partial [Salinivirgaceae bacterium]|nr:S1 RNA-binding domain-containing protein [Salinivirgaceae bacterium]